MIEVIIVLALIALAMNVGIFCWRSTQNTQVFIELQRIYALFTFMHHRAQADGRTYTAHIDEKTKTISTPFFSEKLSDGVVFGIVVGVQGPPASPTHILKNPITFAGSKIDFGKQGIVQAGTVYLTDTARSCLYALSIAVGQISYIRRYVYKGSWIAL